jgi:hypothetical protein
VGRVVTGQMSPADLAAGEAGEGARRGRQPKTHMAVFFATFSPTPFSPPCRPLANRPEADIMVVYMHRGIL